MVVDLLGLELHKAHEEAHRLEHAISPDLEVKIRERLGNPTTCPFEQTHTRQRVHSTTRPYFGFGPGTAGSRLLRRSRAGGGHGVAPFPGGVVHTA